MAARVVVHSVDELSNYCSRLSALKGELETKAGQLKSLSDELTQKAQEMNSVTQAQGSNWQDPQYEKLKGEIEPCVAAVNATSASVGETANTIKTQMTKVDESIQYIRGLIAKLNDIT